MTTIHSIVQSIHTIATHKRKLLENTYSDNTYWLQQQCAGVATNVNNDKYSIQFDIVPLQHDYKRARKAAVVDQIPTYIPPVVQPTEPVAADNDAPVNDIPKPKKGKKAANSKQTTLEHPVQPTAIELGETDIAVVQPATKKTRGKKESTVPAAAVDNEKPVRSTRAAKKAAESETTIEPIIEPATIEPDDPVVKKGKKAAAGKKGKKQAKDSDTVSNSQTTTLTEPITVDTTAPVRVSAKRVSDAKTPIATYDESMQITESVIEPPVEPITEPIQPISTRASRRVSSKPVSKHATPVSKQPVSTTPTSLSATLSASVDSDEDMSDNTIVADTADEIPTTTKSPLLTSMQTYDIVNKHSNSTTTSGNNSLTKPLPNNVMSVSAVSLASSMLHAHNNNHNNNNIVRPSVPGVNLNAMPTVKVPILLHKPQQSITVPLSQLNNTANTTAIQTHAQTQRTSLTSTDIKNKRLSQQKQDALKAAETAAIKQKYELSKQLHESNIAETKRMKSRSNSNNNAVNVDSDKPVTVDDIEMSVDDSTTSNSQPTVSTTTVPTLKPIHTKQSSTELTQPTTVKPLIKPTTGTVLDVTQIKAQKELLAAQHKQKQLIAEQRRKQLEAENLKMQQLKDLERIKREEEAAKNRAALLKQKTIDIKSNTSTLTQPVKPIISTVKPLVKPTDSMAPPVKPVLQSITNTTVNAKPITAAAIQLTQPVIETPKKSLVVTNTVQPAVNTTIQQATPNSLVKSAAKGAHFSFSPAAKMITPAKQPMKQGDSENYEMSDHSGSDSDDDSQQSRGKKIPAWARDPLLSQELKQQIDIDPDTIFPVLPDTCDLSTIFKSFRQNERFRKRYSSGNWTGDTLTRSDEITYKKHMGFYNQSYPHATL